MFTFREVMINKVSRSSPVNVSIRNATLPDGLYLRMQDIVNVTRILQRARLKQEVIFNSDFQDGMYLILDGALLQDELVGYGKDEHGSPIMALKELCDAYEVTCWFDDEKINYVLGPDLFILDEYATLTKGGTNANSKR